MKSFKTPLHHTSWWAGEKRSFQIETSKCNICIGSGLHQGQPEKGDVDGLRVFNCRKCFMAMLQIIIWHQLKEQIYQIKARHELAYFSLKICSGKFELCYNWNMMHISGISENDLNIYTLKYAKSMQRLRTGICSRRWLRCFLVEYNLARKCEGYLASMQVSLRAASKLITATIMEIPRKYYFLPSFRDLSEACQRSLPHCFENHRNHF